MNNRKIVIIVVVLISVVAVIFGLWKWMTPKKINQQQPASIEYKEITLENKKEIADWKKYENDLYKYQISYPNDWHIFADEANLEFSELKLNDETSVRQGGTVFWSNKDNINYTQENKPSDFLLLGLMIYEKNEGSLAEFANFLGFTQEVQSSSIAFKADNIEGKEYISMGTNEENPRIAIIFKKDNNFYVFHLGFVGENQENLKVMEGIVGSFKSL